MFKSKTFAAAAAFLAVGATVGWVESAGGVTGGATLSISIALGASDNSDTPQSGSVVVFVNGPNFYQQKTVYSGTIPAAQLTLNPTITVPSAPPGAYIIGAELEMSSIGGPNIDIEETPVVTSSLGGTVGMSVSNNEGTTPNVQAVSTFFYRNKLIPPPPS
jgi:hypothetical protein